MATTVNIHEAKTRLSQLIAAVEQGEEVVIARNGVPTVSLVPVKRKRAKFGFDKGRVWISDDFDARDPEIEAMFNDAPLTSEPVPSKKRRGK